MIRCHFCTSVVEDVPQAIEDGWIPDYWDEHAGREVSAPVCEGCHLFGPLAEDERGHYMPVCLTVA